MADGDNTSEIDCGYNGRSNDTQYLILGILHTCSASLSFLSSLLVIILILLFKKYTFFVQRLILYLSISALLYSAAAALARTDYTGRDDFPPHFCEAIGFLTQYTQWMLLLSITVITLDILLRVCLNRSTHLLEPVYLIIIGVFPATFNWLPFLQDLYGPAGSWCWIRGETWHNGVCRKDGIGIIYQFTLWYGPLFAVLLMILFSYVVILAMLRQYRRRMNIYNHEQMQLLDTMKKEVFILMWYPLVFMLINIFPLTNRIIHAAVHSRIYPLWVLHAIISPLQGGFIAIVYAFDPETRRKLNISSVYGAIQQHLPCLRKQGRVQEYPSEIIKESEESQRPLLFGNK